VHFGPFQEFAAIARGAEFVDGGEVVLAAVLLTRTRLARGVRDRQADRLVLRQQRVDQRGLAGLGATTMNRLPG
jgi:hypothetical protein